MHNNLEYAMSNCPSIFFNRRRLATYCSRFWKSMQFSSLHWCHWWETYYYSSMYFN